MLKDPRSKSQFLQWMSCLVKGRGRKIQTVRIQWFSFKGIFWSRGLSTKQLEACTLFNVQLAVVRFANALVLWTLHPVKMFMVINQFLLLQKGLVYKQILSFFSSLLAYTALCCSQSRRCTNQSLTRSRIQLKLYFNPRLSIVTITG